MPRAACPHVVPTRVFQHPQAPVSLVCARSATTSARCPKVRDPIMCSTSMARSSPVAAIQLPAPGCTGREWPGEHIWPPGQPGVRALHHLCMSRITTRSRLCNQDRSPGPLKEKFGRKRHFGPMENERAPPQAARYGVHPWTSLEPNLIDLRVGEAHCPVLRWLWAKHPHLKRF